MIFWEVVDTELAKRKNGKSDASPPQQPTQKGDWAEEGGREKMAATTTTAAEEMSEKMEEVFALEIACSLARYACSSFLPRGRDYVLC